MVVVKHHLHFDYQVKGGCRGWGKEAHGVWEPHRDVCKWLQSETNHQLHQGSHVLPYTAASRAAPFPGCPSTRAAKTKALRGNFTVSPLLPSLSRYLNSTLSCSKRRPEVSALLSLCSLHLRRCLGQGPITSPSGMTFPASSVISGAPSVSTFQSVLLQLPALTISKWIHLCVSCVSNAWDSGRRSSKDNGNDGDFNG